MKNDDKMGTKKVLPLLVEFSIPAIIGMLVNAIYNIVDRMFIGNAPELGSVGLAGISICYPVTLVLMVTIRFASFSSIFLLNHSFYLVARCKSPAKLFIFLVLLVCLVHAEQALDDESDTDADCAEDQCQFESAHITHRYIQ